MSNFPLDPSLCLMLQRDAGERQLLLNEFAMRFPSTQSPLFLLPQPVSADVGRFVNMGIRPLQPLGNLNFSLRNALVTAMALEQERKRSIQLKHTMEKSWIKSNDILSGSDRSTVITSSKDNSISCSKEEDQDEKKLPSIALSDKKPKKKENKWLFNLEQLREYKNVHGDCIVPRGYALNPRLASWVAEQRKQYKLFKDGKQSSITPKRVAMLDEIDFAWNAQEAAWDRHMKDLKSFRIENGHCHVPLNHADYPKLGLWVKEQRRHHTLMKQGKACHMTAERIAELTAIGFCWDTHEATWLERLRELADFRDRHGTCVVPTSFAENPKLGTWVHHQRRQYKKFMEGKPCHITKERIHALEQLGFVWYPRERQHIPSSSSETTSESSSSVSLQSQDEESSSSDLDSRPRKRIRSS